MNGKTGSLRKYMTICLNQPGSSVQYTILYKKLVENLANDSRVL